MTKLKILVPLDGYEKSLHAINWLKKVYTKEEAEVTLVNVVELSTYLPSMSPFEDIPSYDFVELYEISKKRSSETLEEGEKQLEGYHVSKLSLFGQSADMILKTSKDGDFDMIIMTKSSVVGLFRFLGSVATKVVHDSEIPVVVIP